MQASDEAWDIITHLVGNDQTGGKVPGNGPEERYVSLKHEQVQALPVSLKHLDLGALEHNLPQHSSPSDELSDTKIPDGVTQKTEIFVDSGMDVTPTGTDISQNSASTTGFSPNVSNRVQAPAPEKIDTNLSSTRAQVPVQAPAHEKISAQRIPIAASSPLTKPSTNQDKSTSNLSFRKDGYLDLTQVNIDAIVNSQLTTEEKMDLMAAMCECEEAANSFPSKLQAKLMQSSTSLHTDETTHSGVQAGGTKDTMLSSDSEMHPRERHSSYSDRHSHVTNRMENSVFSEDSLNNPSPLKLQTSLDNSRQLSKNEPRLNGPKDNVNILGINSVRSVDFRLHPDQNAKINYGIDIEAWMRNYEADMDEDDISGLDVDTGSEMRHHIQKLKSVKEER